jgi:hypothetical protein
MNNVTDAVKELRRIIEIEGLSRKDGFSAREAALNNWINDNIMEVVVDNDVIKKNLTSEEEDFLKYYLAYQIADKLLEECATVVSEGNKIRVKILALAKKYPKNKE